MNLNFHAVILQIRLCVSYIKLANFSKNVCWFLDWDFGALQTRFFQILLFEEPILFMVLHKMCRVFKQRSTNYNFRLPTMFNPIVSSSDSKMANLDQFNLKSKHNLHVYFFLIYIMHIYYVLYVFKSVSLPMKPAEREK